MVSRLRVQLVSKPTSPRTGIGRYAFEIERGLRAAGIDLRLAPLENPLPRPVIRLGRRAGYDLETFFQSYPLRADAQPGYVTHLTSQTLGILLLTQRLPRPVIVTVHDILPYLLRHDPALRVYSNRVQRVMDALAMRGLRRADRLIADSRYTRRTLVDALGIPEERIDVVHLGVDTDRFKPMPVPDDFRARYCLPADRRYVLYVGSEDPRKNLPALLRAMALLRHACPDVHLLKVGAAAFTEQRERHRRICGELGIDDRMHWFDDVPEEDLPLFYNAADLFAFPSLYEGFGFPVLEALACGTPVVALRASSIPELTGDAATLVDAGDDQAFAAALEGALTGYGPPVDARVAQAASFTWNDTVTRTIDLYRIVRCNRTSIPAVVSDGRQKADIVRTESRRTI